MLLIGLNLKNEEKTLRAFVKHANKKNHIIENICEIILKTYRFNIQEVFVLFYQ